MKSITLFGVPITSASQSEILEYITKRLQNKSKKFFIVTPNPEIMMFAQTHSEFKAILNKAEVSLPDGVGVMWSAKLLGKELKGRVTGVDLMQEICKESVRNGLELGFLGGRGGVAEKAVKCLQKLYPGIRVTFVSPEWNENGFVQNLLSRETTQIRTRNHAKVNGKWQMENGKLKHIDILFVAFGFPKQEEWIARNLEKIPATCAMGVGGAFDFISGNVPRAPKLIRYLGFEWLFRLIIQPWRWKRQLVLVKFILLVLKEFLIVKFTWFNLLKSRNYAKQDAKLREKQDGTM